MESLLSTKAPLIVNKNTFIDLAKAPEAFAVTEIAYKGELRWTNREGMEREN